MPLAVSAWVLGSETLWFWQYQEGGDSCALPFHYVECKHKVTDGQCERHQDLIGKIPMHYWFSNHGHVDEFKFLC